MRCILLLLCFVFTTIDVYSRAAEIDTLKEEVLGVLTEQATAWNNGDIGGYMEGYWKSDSLLFTSGGRMQRGWKATLEKYRTAYATKAKMGALTFSSIEVHHLSSGAAWVFGRWDILRDVDPAGGVFTLVLKLFPEGWKIVHDHTSVDPLPEPKPGH